METNNIFMLFNLPESLVQNKKEVIRLLYQSAPLYRCFFQHVQKSSLRNPDRRKTSPSLTWTKKLDDFIVASMLHLLLSTALSDDDQDEHLLPLVISNYGTDKHPMSEEDARILLQSLRDLSQEPIIFSFQKKMRKHRDGLLRTWQFKDVLDLYRRHLTPRFYEKKNLGQVFTPFPLINKILDQIPDYVMRNPNSTFLDPSAGMGGFLVALYHRLMTSLVVAIPSESRRHDHIIRNMLFAAEITKNNAQMMRKIFGPNLHVHHGDALKMDTEKAFGVKKFDVIVGNPPFEKEQRKETRRNAGESLWPSFVEKSIREWLVQGGWFGMVLPPGWRKPSDEKSRTTGLWKLMTRDTSPVWVHLMDADETKMFFEGNVSIRADLVVLKKEDNTGNKTRVIGVDGKEKRLLLQKMPFLPNKNFYFWKDKLTLNPEQGTDVIFSRSTYGSDKNSVKKDADRLYQHPVIHSIHNDGTMVLLYAKEKKEEGGFGVPKLIFNEFGRWNTPVLDRKGEFGMSQHAFGLPIASLRQGQEMLRFFQNENNRLMFQEDLMWSTSKPTIPWKAFWNIRKDFYK